MKNRDNFDNKIVESLGKRASFICSNPDCKCLTLAASGANETKFIYIGVAAHITAASKGGPRFDENKKAQERSDISNGIFLCANCSVMIDKNKGIDYTVGQLLEILMHAQSVGRNFNQF